MPDRPDSLYDRYREAGLGDHLVEEVERRLKKRKQRRRSALRASSAALALVAALCWGVPYFRDTAMLVSPVGNQSTVALEDGSHAELNANTTLHADFRYGRRLLRLEHGEAFFSVVHDSGHPFIVETPAGSVRVTGTKFNVRVEDDGQTEVTLVEGHVAVKASSAATVPLDPSQQAELSAASVGVHPLKPREMDSALAWRKGEIVLDGLPMGEALKRVADYHGCSITVDPSVTNVRLGGTYSLRSLPLFLKALESTGAVTVLSNGENAYRIVAR